MTHPEPTIFELIGGEDTITRLVDVFYAKVEADEDLRAVFPDELEPGKQWQKLFLTQLFGGPDTYSQIRGHPRLRMRHMPFQIDSRAADLWLGHMLDAIDELEIEEPARDAMISYFRRAAPHMINVFSSGSSTIDIE